MVRAPGAVPEGPGFDPQSGHLFCQPLTLDSFHHSLGFVLVRLGSLAPIPIGEGSLGGAAGDGERGGVSGGAGAGAGATASTAGRAGGPIYSNHTWR